MARPQPGCALKHKISSKALQVFEGIIAKLVLVISICSIIYSENWLPVFINFSFLFLALFALGSYAICYKKRQPALVLPMLVNLSVCIFWIMIWVYASVTSITTGHLWSLEWLGGPKSSRAATSHDIMDPNYVDPNQTSPETKKSIKYGIIITAVSLVVLAIKIYGWTIARRTFIELRHGRINADSTGDSEDGEKRRDSDLGEPSPPYPVVLRVAPPPPVERSYGFEEARNTSPEQQRFVEKNEEKRSPGGHLESCF